METYNVCAVAESAREHRGQLEADAQEWFVSLEESTRDLGGDHRKGAVARTALFAAAAELPKDEQSKKAVTSFLRQHIGGDHAMWTAGKYNDEFKKIPELVELTTTPFMVQIVTSILPRLSEMRRPVSEIKSGMVVMLGEAVAETAWAVANEPRESVTKLSKESTPSILASLGELQQALDGNGEARTSWLAELQAAADAVADRVEALVEKHYEEWGKDGMLPEGCGLGEQTQSNAKSKTEGKKRGGKAKAVTTKRKVLPKVSLATAVRKALLRTLKRQPTRRCDIYDQFVDMYIDREIGKSMGQRNTIAPEALKIEAMEYARQLSVFMVEQNRTKVAQRKRSMLC